MRILILLICCSVVSSWVIYRRSHKRKLICREETEWGNTTSNLMTNSAVRSNSEEGDSEESTETSSRRTRIRNRRDIEVDPVHKEPIIFLGAKSNSTVFIDDGDFDIVSDQLSKEEIELVKQQIMDTCNALNSN